MIIYNLTKIFFLVIIIYIFTILTINAFSDFIRGWLTASIFSIYWNIYPSNNENPNWLSKENGILFIIEKINLSIELQLKNKSMLIKIIAMIIITICYPFFLMYMLILRWLISIGIVLND